MSSSNRNDNDLMKLFDNHTIEQFEINRNTGLGGAGVCVVILLTLAQMQLKSQDAKLAITLASSGLPVWLLSASINEYFVFLGERIFPFYSKIRNLLRIINVTGVFLLGYSLAVTVGIVTVNAKTALIFSVIISVIVFQAFHLHLAKWLKRSELS